MTSDTPASIKSCRAPYNNAAVHLVVIAAIIGTLVYPSALLASVHWDNLRSDENTITEAEGAIPAGVTVFDGEYPGVANLDPDLLSTLQQAATHAADYGIVFHVNSGWRSPKYQNQLLREAVWIYGSEAEAARWVATAKTSAHVSGDAVDIGHIEAATWLSEHGAEYGLCQIYSNEPWHYELRSQTINRACPPPYRDPTYDPRMQR